MKPFAKPFTIEITAILLAAFCASCSSNITLSGGPDNPPVVKVDQAFAPAGSIEMQLDAGDYHVRPAAGDRIRVTFAGNTGNANATLAISGTHATVSVTNAPHNNFKATIEVPKTADFVLHLAAGDLDIDAITGSKDIDSKAGDVKIAAGSPNDYASVDATVTVGDLQGGPFGDADGTLAHHLAWSGPGKYTLRARLGAGDLQLR